MMAEERGERKRVNACKWGMRRMEKEEEEKEKERERERIQFCSSN